MLEYFDELLTIERMSESLGMSKSELEAIVDELIGWFKTQRHLPHNAINETMVSKFVYGCKGNLENAKKKLDGFFSVRNLLPELYSIRDPLSEELVQARNCASVVLLPGLTKEGARLGMMILRERDASLVKTVHAIVRAFNMYDVWLNMDPYAEKIYILVDLKEVTRHHILSSPKIIHQSSYAFQKTYPVRLKGMYFINVYPLFSVLIEKFIKPLFGSKLSKRVSCFSSDLTQLPSVVPLSLLPKEYGGDAPSINEIEDKWEDIILRHREWLMSSGTVTSNESLRTGPCPISAPGCSIM